MKGKDISLIIRKKGTVFRKSNYVTFKAITVKGFNCLLQPFQKKWFNSEWLTTFNEAEQTIFMVYNNSKNECSCICIWYCCHKDQILAV